MLRHAVDVEPLHVGLGRAAAHLAREVVDRHGLVDELGVGAVRVEVLLDDVVVAEGDVLGGHRLAVAPHGALADVEGPHQAVVRHLPALGDARHRLAVGAVADDVVVVEAPRLVVDGAAADERVEVVGRLGRADPEDDLPRCRRPATGCRRRPGRRRRRRRALPSAGARRRGRDTLPVATWCCVKPWTPPLYRSRVAGRTTAPRTRLTSSIFKPSGWRFPCKGGLYGKPSVHGREYLCKLGHACRRV